MTNQPESVSADHHGGPTGLRIGASDQASALAMQTKIVETAERLFRQFGYQKTTVADIAEDLDMSSANVYRFFTSKIAICEAVVRKVAAEARARVAQTINNSELSATERLRLLVQGNHSEVFDRCISDKRIHTMVHKAIEQNWGVVHEHQESIRKMMAAVIQEGMDSGEFDVTDADNASRCFQAAMIAICHPVILDNRLSYEDDVKPSVEPMIEFGLRALGVKLDELR